MFKIDFDELLFLAEACIPPVPIARGMFWKRLIGEIYNDLTDNQREQMYKYIKRTIDHRWEDKDKEAYGYDECQKFLNRYNPDNQYKLVVEYEGKKSAIFAYKHDDNRYYKNYDVSIIEEYIKNIEKV